MLSTLATPGIRLESILLATDFSRECDRPLQYAAALAHQHHARLQLVHVVSSVGFAMVGTDLWAAAVDAATRDARQIERKLVANKTLEGINHNVLVRQGAIAPQVKQVVEQQHADLLVLGTHGRGSWERVVMGSTAEEIIRTAGCPVLGVGPDCEAPEVADGQIRRPILFATDFGPASHDALAYALAFATAAKSQLVLLHVLRSLPIGEGVWAHTQQDFERVQAAGRASAIEKLENLLGPENEERCNARFHVEFGMPAEGILNAASFFDAGMIVMGLHWTKFVNTACHAPWDVAFEVLSHAACPVLAVKKKPEAES